MHTTDHSSTRQAFAAARRQGQARHREVAKRLGLSEAELIAAHAGAHAQEESPLKATALRAEWPQIVEALPTLGSVMALTRNESCVHEKVGVYQEVSGQHGVGLVHGREIDLRIFYTQWAFGFAVEERLNDGAMQRSLQFFDAQGVAIHKVFLKPQSELAAYAALVQRFAQETLAAGVSVQAAAPAKPEAPDAAIDVQGLRAAWASLRDTHEFFGLLRQFGVSRTQALRLADPSFVQPLGLSAAQEVLSHAAQSGLSIMVFVGNPGMIQIHTGPVQKVSVMGPWLNVLDPGFNLHLREDHIDAAWLVRKPTIDGLVTSVELFDAQGNTIAMLFGERKPGQREHCDWRELLGRLFEEPSCSA